LLPFFPPAGCRLPSRAQPPKPHIAFLETCDDNARAQARTDFSIIEKDMAMGLCSSRRGAQHTANNVWDTFCAALAIDTTLADTNDPIPALQLFAHRYRVGAIAPSGGKVRGKTVADVLRALGQTFAHLGLPDPRLTPSGQLDLRLTRQLAAYNKQDDLPTRVKPIPLSVLRHATTSARIINTPFHQALADMITIGFYFLLRPGEYAATSNPESSPFRLADVRLYRGATRLTNNQLHPANPAAAHIRPTFVGLVFTNQKNGVRGEVIGLGQSGDPAFCPVAAITHRVQQLLFHGAPANTPLYTYYNNTQTFTVSTGHLTSTL
jgi:hypothetical protein